MEKKNGVDNREFSPGEFIGFLAIVWLILFIIVGIGSDDGN